MTVSLLTSATTDGETEHGQGNSSSEVYRLSCFPLHTKGEQTQQLLLSFKCISLNVIDGVHNLCSILRACLYNRMRATPGIKVCYIQYLRILLIRHTSSTCFIKFYQILKSGPFEAITIFHI